MILQALRAGGEAMFLPGYHRRMARIGTLGTYTRIAYGPHARQYLLHRPARRPGAPAVVWWHGGGWQFGSPDRLLGFGEYFHRRGYAVYLASHRRLPRFRGSALLADALDARRLVEQRHPGPQRLLLGGVSSGGHLAALCALRQNRTHAPSSVAGLLTCAAPLSLGDLPWSPTLRRLAGSGSSPQRGSLDPLSCLTSPPDFPALMLHGTADGLVPYRAAQRFWRKAERIGWTSLQAVTLPGGSHLDANEWVFQREAPHEVH